MEIAYSSVTNSVRGSLKGSTPFVESLAPRNNIGAELRAGEKKERAGAGECLPEVVHGFLGSVDHVCFFYSWEIDSLHDSTMTLSTLFAACSVFHSYPSMATVPRASDPDL
jgi:hypothetical protein